MADRLANSEEFELILKAAGIENWKEVATEMRVLKTGATEAAGSEAAGTGFAGLSKNAFMAEPPQAHWPAGRGSRGRARCSRA